MLLSEKYDIAARYFQHILVNLDALHQFGEVDPCTRRDVDRQLNSIYQTHGTAIRSIRADDATFHRASQAFAQSLSDQQAHAMREPLGYDWSWYREDSWGALIVRSLRLYEAQLR